MFYIDFGVWYSTYTVLWAAAISIFSGSRAAACDHYGALTCYHLYRPFYGSLRRLRFKSNVNSGGDHFLSFLLAASRLLRYCSRSS